MNTSKSLPGRVLSWIWRTISVLYRAAMVLVLLIVLALVWLAVQGRPPPKVENNVALTVAPSGVLVEQVDQDPEQRLVENLSGQPPSQTLVRDVTDALDAARDDKRIKLAVVRLDDMDYAGLPQLEEIAAAIDRFKAGGKKVFIYGDSYDQGQYLIAAHASDVSLDPLGLVFLEGFSVYDNYFKQGLDKLGVDVNVFRVGEYKSAVEPFVRDSMSEDAKSANRAWLDVLWSHYTHDIAHHRGLADTVPDDYIAHINQGLAAHHDDAAALAHDLKLVDDIETLGDFRKRMGQRVGMDEDTGSFRQIGFRDYLRATRYEHRKERKGKSKVALIVVQGEIVDGDSYPGVAGGDTISDLLDRARRDDDTAAVVLRVDSPGGSVTGSEQIRRGVEDLQKDGKPVVVSMSSVAASGGYWSSMDADEIWAHDTTITGSIGIFGLFPTFDRPLAKLGIHTDGVGTTPLAGAFRVDRPLSPEAAGLIRSQVQQGYHEFIEGVAEGRDLPVDTVDQIARGRVWSGADAKELGLVDHIGGLREAVASAAKLAKLKPGSYRLEELRSEETLAEKLLLPFTGEIHLSSSLNVLSGAPHWLSRVHALMAAAEPLTQLNDPHGLYAICFCTPSIASRAVR